VKKILVVLVVFGALALTGILVLKPSGSDSVVLITVDSCGPLPLRLGSWQAQCMEFTSAICPAPLLLPSHASIHTGLYPYNHGVRDNYGFALSESHITLAQRFQEARYATAAFVSAFPLGRAFGLARGFDVYDDVFTPLPFRRLPDATDPGEGYPDRTAIETVDRALAWLAQRKGPFFLWVHLHAPHKPHTPPEPHFSRFMMDPYAGEMEYTSTQIVKLLENLPKRCVVAVTGSHGEAVYDHGPEKTHGMFLRESTIRVPLKILTPHRGTGGGTVDEQVQIVDLYPTLLNLVGIPTGQDVDGINLADTLQHKMVPPDRPALVESLMARLRYEGPELWAVRNNDFKLVWTPTSLQLYRMNTMQVNEEEVNVSSEYPDVVNRLMTHLPDGSKRMAPQTQWKDQEREILLRLAGQTIPQKENIKGLDIRTECRKVALEADRLLLLGDLKTALDILEERRQVTGPSPAIDTRLAYGHRQRQQFRLASEILAQLLLREPGHIKARIHLVYCLKEMNFLNAALLLAQSTAELYPQDGETHYLWGSLRSMEGKHAEAFAIYKKGIEQAPNTFSPLYNQLALEYQRMGNLQDAMICIEEGLQVNPQDAELWNNLGTMQASQNRIDEALQSFRRALEADPSLADVRLNLAECLEALDKIEEALAEYRVVTGIYTASEDARSFARSRIEQSSLSETQESP